MIKNMGLRVFVCVCVCACVRVCARVSVHVCLCELGYLRSGHK